MPSIPLYPPSFASGQLSTHQDEVSNPLPPLLQTPSGLAILELQGTINFPAPEPKDGQEEDDENGSERSATTVIETELGRLMFPDFSPLNPDDTKWMKRVYLYAGRYQRMTGEVKKLARPIAIIRRRQKPSVSNGTQHADQDAGDELEIVEIVKYKILFASRPEPVSLE
jgi:hypothetical protein